MTEKEVVVNIPNGLHARPAAELVKRLKTFTCSIEIDNGKNKVNAKSILSLMGTGIKEGQTIKVIIDGEDAEEALTCIESYLKSAEYDQTNSCDH